jgi:hypothetical protein
MKGVITQLSGANYVCCIVYCTFLTGLVYQISQKTVNRHEATAYG